MSPENSNTTDHFNMENKNPEIEQDEIIQAFALEAVHKLLSEKSIDELINKDQLYAYFGSDPEKYKAIYFGVRNEIVNSLKVLENETSEAFNKLSVKFLVHRNFR